MRKIIATFLVAVLAISSILIFPLGNDNGIGLREIQAAEQTSAAADADGIESPAATPVDVYSILYGQTPRDGYILAPTMFGLSGIDTNSSFVLRTPIDYDTLPLITIDGQSQPVITREDSDTFVIAPAVPLTPNSVYVFRLAQNDSDITWAFQTSIIFELTSVFPSSQSTNVPIRTGIEIDFSIGNNINIEEHFSIYPHVAGDFTYRNSTSIFMPASPLAYGQIYTVTIRAGVVLPGTSQTVTTDHVFSFETAPRIEREWRHSWPSRVSFSTRYIEFPSFASPSVTFWLSYGSNAVRPLLNIDI